ncbi:OprO/OprP family phosphate-selective porin [Thermomonas aquatica]|uniref:Carbohydrate porin n=1 Tax=Thermomonas aquatica TaxID=2202149 RepID=A0A5B7ZPS3_9GAMM|nr:porin [Thermomonas aquatica]QDA57060.1 carbohydrate porin [Thermomonas aquatica]
MTRPTRLGLAIALALSTLPAHAADPTTQQLLARIAALEQRLAAVEAANAAPVATVAPDELDQRLRVVERRQELDAEADAAKAASAPALSLNDKGLSVKSAAGDFEVKLRGLVQADARHFGGDTSAAQTDTFLFRRIRPTLEGSFGKLVGFRLTPEFAGDSATIVDAYVDLKFDPRATVRIGKLKGPIGLERLQSGGATAFIERGFPTELAPNRDLGVQLQGELAGGGLSYAAGVFNGAPDGRDAATTNPDGDFELAARVFAEPWKNSANALSGLGFGIAASHGDKHGSGNNFLPRYRTPGQVQFFNYRSTVLADGEHLRVSPQAYYYGGRLGLLGEYISSRQEVRAANGTRADLENTAWQVTAGYVLTGEDASYRGVLKPSNAFTLGGEGWGAFEVVGRYGRLDIDHDAFPLFADPNVASSAARSWGIGLNWYLNANVKLVANYARTAFDAAPGATARDDEDIVFTRAQFSF